LNKKAKMVATTAPPTLNWKLPWGPHGSLELELPAEGPIADARFDVVRPRLNDPLADYPGALQQALESPVGADRLEQLASPGMRIAIVVDDPSRWTPIREALPVVLGRLHRAGISASDVTISVGVGRHHAVDTRTMQVRLGESVAASYRCFSPPVDDLAAYVDLGQTPEGVPLRVFQPVAQADLRILISSVLPHLQAGFGGGYKLIFPGACHRTTLGSLHRLGLEDRSDGAVLLGGDAASNPMRQAIRAAALRLGACWSISHVIGGPGQLFQVLAGDPEKVQDLLALEVRRRFLVPCSSPTDLVVAGNYPWPGDPMQSFKVLFHHQAACRRGGALVGFFWTDPEEVDRSIPSAVLRAVAALRGLGAWAIRRSLPMAHRIAAGRRSPAAFMLHWARELVVDRTVLVYAPPLCKRLGSWLGPVRLFPDQRALWAAAVTALPERKHLGDPLRVRVFPHGGLTYVTD
jgi:hypothetical protein